jgi:hypothetical protein
MLKEGNVLGSGPSRVSYIPNGLPTIGCNFPWTKVDWTLIFDHEPILKWLETPSVFPEGLPFIISWHCYDYLKKNKLLDKIESRIICVFKRYNSNPNLEYPGNAGHYATEWMIKQGFNKLNLYGMDNYFGDLLCKDNFSHQLGAIHYIENIDANWSEEQLVKRGKDWQTVWKRIIKCNPQVEFNFIK